MCFMYESHVRPYISQSPTTARLTTRLLVLCPRRPNTHFPHLCLMMTAQHIRSRKAPPASCTMMSLLTMRTLMSSHITRPCKALLAMCAFEGFVCCVG